MVSLSDRNVTVMIANRYKNYLLHISSSNWNEPHDAERASGKASEFLEELPFPVDHAASICWVMQTHKFSIIPEELYTKGMGKQLLSYTARLEEGDHIYSDHWNNSDAIMVYAIPQDFISLLKEKFPGSTFIHAGSSLESIYRHYAQSNTFALLHVEHDEVDLFIARKGEVIFYNKFRYEVEEDIVYYVLFALEQNSIIPPDLELKISGRSLKGEKLQVLLEQYIGEVKEVEIPETFKFTNQISPREVRQHFNILGAL